MGRKLTCSQVPTPDPMPTKPHLQRTTVIKSTHSAKGTGTDKLRPRPTWVGCGSITCYLSNRGQGTWPFCVCPHL